jgi:hypothetical protein
MMDIGGEEEVHGLIESPPFWGRRGEPLAELMDAEGESQVVRPEWEGIVGETASGVLDRLQVANAVLASRLDACALAEVVPGGDLDDGQGQRALL